MLSFNNWSQEKSISYLSDGFGIPKKTIMAVFSKLREIFSSYLLLELMRLGGPGVICQIDESLFSHKVKAHRGRIPREQILVFGIVDISRSPALCYLEVVARRNAETLLPIVSRVVCPGSITHSDEWAAYDFISIYLGFSYGVANHYLQFVNHETNVHTQHIESCWNRQKQRIKKMRGLKRKHLQEYLNEFTWRDSCHIDSYLALFALLAI